MARKKQNPKKYVVKKRKKPGKKTGKKRVKCTKNKKSLKSYQKNPSDSEGIFQYAEPPVWIENRRVAGLESICLYPTESDLNGTVTFNLTDKAWYMFTNGTKFFCTVKLQKATVTGTGDNKVIGSWTDVTATDKTNLQFYTNFISKKFGKISFHRNQQEIRTSKGYDRLTNTVESYLYAHLDDSQRKLIFGTSTNDSSTFTALRKSKFKNGHAEYDSVITPFFTGRPVACSFSRTLICPFPTSINSNKRSLHCSVLPYYEDVDYSFQVEIDKNDNAVFYQTGAKTTKVYRLKVTELQLLLYKIRFVDSLAYQVKAQSIFGNCTRNLIGFPCLSYQMYSNAINKDNTRICRKFLNCKVPNKLLIFKVKESLLTGGQKLPPYSGANIDFWLLNNIDKINVTFDGLEIYDNDKSTLAQSTNFTKYLNLTQLTNNFIGNWDLSKNVDFGLISNDDYLFPSVLMSFNLWNKPDELVSPPLGGNNLLLKEGTLELNITFDHDDTTEAGQLIYCFFYEQLHPTLKLQDGNVISPLQF